MYEQSHLKQVWSKNVDEIFQMFGTSLNGLSDAEVSIRSKIHGKNVFNKSNKRTAVTILLKQFVSPLIFLLIGAILITAFLGEWVEVVVISLAVLVNTMLGFYREYHAENTIDKLSTFIKERSRVIRGGVEQEVDSEQIVIGDIIRLAYGNRVPADAYLINVNNVTLNESILTGESQPVQKKLGQFSVSAPITDRYNMVHAGTLVVDGFATAVVADIGSNTEIGKIAELVASTSFTKTPIQKGLDKLSWIIFALVVAIVIGIFVLGISRGEPVFQMLILSVAVSVGAVPEALPIALTVILSKSAERIAKKQGIVRTLVAAETLGSTTLIMTDKTGTLTEANMKLVGIYTLPDLLFSKSGVHNADAETNDILSMALTNIDVLVENPEDSIKNWLFKGKPFEVNIAKTARDNGIDISSLRKSKSNNILIPFNSTHKFSVSRDEKSFIVMGAPDVLLARSKISKDEFAKIESHINNFSTEGKRLIAVARMDLNNNNELSTDAVKGLSFIGILAFHDPVRNNVPEAIKKIESFGINIIMITGDLKGTAMAVAREVGWNISEEQVITGTEMQALSDTDLIKIIPDKKIFARVTPEDKLRVGRLYQQLGEVVAMTGDGVNDSPALKAMDIGIALGSGSDVAKSTADLVLLDDNFEIIATAVQEGRRTLTNVRKTFVYLMSNSLDEVFVIGGSLLVGIALPLNALQIIWVNLFTGSLPALAFAYDENFDHKLSKTKTLKSIFTKQVNFLTFGIGVISSLLLFVMYYGLIQKGVEVGVARSVFFVCFASYILAVSFSFRSLHKPLFSYPVFSNKKLNQSIIIAVVILIATMAIPTLRELFDLAPMPLIWVWFVVAWLLFNVALVEFAKYLFRKAHV